MKYCTECGTKNIKTAKFCTNCGHPFAGVKVAAKQIDLPEEEFEQEVTDFNSDASDVQINFATKAITGKELIAGLQNYTPESGKRKPYTGSILEEMKGYSRKVDNEIE